MSDPQTEPHDDRPTVVGTDPEMALGENQSHEGKDSDEDTRDEDDVIDPEDHS